MRRNMREPTTVKEMFRWYPGLVKTEEIDDYYGHKLERYENNDWIFGVWDGEEISCSIKNHLIVKYKEIDNYYRRRKKD